MRTSLAKIAETRQPTRLLPFTHRPDRHQERDGAEADGGDDEVPGLSAVRKAIHAAVPLFRM